MIVSKAAGYGIRALAYLASQVEGRPCGLREIAEFEQIPPAYLGKVLGELRRHHLLRSTKGKHGGYQLARPPEDITLWEVILLLEPDLDLDTCILGYGVCSSRSACSLDEDWQRLRIGLVRLLQNSTVSQIAVFADTHPAGEVV
ncbi:MAG: Rrf2 family transcriptional regulator [Acidobacteria bacterium]|nr:Rrf2 family transcriptional regulator [Acidobacteriota bacterium]